MPIHPQNPLEQLADLGLFRNHQYLRLVIRIKSQEFLQRDSFERKIDGYGCAVAGDTFEIDSAGVPLDNRVDIGETQARSIHAFGG